MKTEKASITKDLNFQYPFIYVSKVDLCFPILTEYHWDASDWAPRPSLPNISEVTTKECPDSPRSSPHSNESNTHVNNIHHNGMTESGVYTDTDLMESEYVGDSEYAENEYDTDYPSPPSYQHILGLHDYTDGDMGVQGGGEQLEDIDNYQLPHNMMNHMHPNYYLPNHSFNNDSNEVGDIMPNHIAPNVDLSDTSDNEDNNSVVHYGFPGARRSAGSRVPDICVTDSEMVQSPSIGDTLSVSLGGGTSTNVSFSDISGLCDIEDSEINPSDDESIDENTPFNMKRFDTQV